MLVGGWSLFVKNGKGIGHVSLLLGRGMCFAPALSPFPCARRRCFSDNVQAVGAERLQQAYPLLFQRRSTPTEFLNEFPAVFAFWLQARHGDVLQRNKENIVPEGGVVQLAGDLYFAVGSSRSRANMLLESMPGGVDGLPDIGLPLSGESDDINDATCFQGIRVAIEGSGLLGAVCHFAPLRGASVEDVLNVSGQRAITRLLAVDPAKLEVPSTPELIARGCGRKLQSLALPDALLELPLRIAERIGHLVVRKRGLLGWSRSGVLAVGRWLALSWESD